jgi:eukaryotic-like serine/threonine-protein kinase
VVYEMATGKKAFEGKSQASIIGKVLETDPPPISSLRPMTPPALDRCVKTCLAKEPDDRWQTASDLCRELKCMTAESGSHAAGIPTVAARPVRTTWRQVALWSTIASLLVATVTGLAVWNLKPTPSVPRPLTRTVIDLPSGDRLAALDDPAVTISPDGTELAYVAAHSGARQIFVRALDGLEARPVSGTEGAVGPFFSPDGQSLGFFSGSHMEKISLSGGAPFKLSIASAADSFGASWGSHDAIIYAPNVGALQQVSDAGGDSHPVTRLAIDKGQTMHSWPDFLPGAEAVLFTIGPTRSRIAVQSLRSGEQRELALDGTQPRYAASGHVIYARSGNLMAAPFDPKRLQLTGAAIPVVQGVLTLASGAAQYSVSSTGTLVYVPGSEQGVTRELVWVSRNGTEQVLSAPFRNYVYPRISPDGQRLAVGIREEGGQVWLYDFGRKTLTRLTFGGNGNDNPVWTADSKRLAYVSGNGNAGRPTILWQSADGSGGAEALTAGQYACVPGEFSRDGRLLAYVEINPSNGYDIWVLRLADRTAEPFLRTPSYESAPSFSPDGHWLSYVSDESGQFEVYVQPYPGPGAKYQISTEGGSEPVWNPNGQELFYRNGDKMMAVDITTQRGFSIGQPRMLFQGSYVSTLGTLPFYDVSPDGQHFLMLKPTGQNTSLTQIVVVQNWFEELKRLVPTGK